MDTYRTPEERFEHLPDFPWSPSYADVPDGEGDTLRMGYVDAGPADGPVAVLLHGEPSWSFLYRHVIRVLTEAGILDALRGMRRGRSVITIAHRLSTVVDADRILVLEHGRVVEQGTHAALLAQGGRYAAMWTRQLSEPEKGTDLWALQEKFISVTPLQLNLTHAETCHKLMVDLGCQ